MSLWIGTSGFQYPEWKGTFYPETLSKAKMLAFYADRFSSTESNYTFRHIPSPKTIERWATSTPDAFRWSLKAPQKVTHFAKLRGCADILDYFQQIISALGAKLGPVLFQLPPSFQKDVSVLASFLDDIPSGMRAAFEFRHPSWFDEQVYEQLSARNIALCIADSEKLTTPVLSTADYGYLRLRREDYEKSDVARWADMIQKQQDKWTDAFIYFKHEENGLGPKYAVQMMELLGSAASPTNYS